MPCVQSARPRAELAPFVRAYAQRTVGPTDSPWTESVPAQLEQILNLELGVLPGIRHRGRDVSREVLLGGAQDGFSGTLHLLPGVVSFAVFFWPSGWSQLFNIPVNQTTNNFDDATPLHGPAIRELWNRMGEETSFARRVAIVEDFLLGRLSSAVPDSKISRVAKYLFAQHGAVSIPEVGRQGALSLRHFERLFRMDVGMSPKVFARIARFQAALDAKLFNPARTWLDIAHSFGYYDQMHMVHDFELLGRNAPTQLLLQMGDVRPSALVSSNDSLQ
jgi:AraC-like DNA-binding protein